MSHPAESALPKRLPNVGNNRPTLTRTEQVPMWSGPRDTALVIPMSSSGPMNLPVASEIISWLR